MLRAKKGGLVRAQADPTVACAGGSNGLAAAVLLDMRDDGDAAVVCELLYGLREDARAEPVGVGVGGVRASECEHRRARRGVCSLRGTYCEHMSSPMIGSRAAMNFASHAASDAMKTGMQLTNAQPAPSAMVAQSSVAAWLPTGR